MDVPGHLTLAVDRVGAYGGRFGGAVEIAFPRRPGAARAAFEAPLSGGAGRRIRNAPGTSATLSVRRAIPRGHGSGRSLCDPAPLSREAPYVGVVFGRCVALWARSRYWHHAAQKSAPGESSNLRFLGFAARLANREDLRFRFRRHRRPQWLGLQHRRDSHWLGDWR